MENVNENIDTIKEEVKETVGQDSGVSMKTLLLIGAGVGCYMMGRKRGFRQGRDATFALMRLVSNTRKE